MLLQDAIATERVSFASSLSDAVGINAVHCDSKVMTVLTVKSANCVSDKQILGLTSCFDSEVL